jgi:recombination protein RecR
MLPKSLTQLADRFSALPGIGPKSALRLAVYCLSLEDKALHEFAKSLETIKSEVKYCQTCGNFSEDTECNYCIATDRSDNQILVVESPLDVSVFIPTDYKGKFHVLGGLISPLTGVGPDKLNIAKLISRVQGQPEVEVILACPTSLEGEATAVFISQKLTQLTQDITGKSAKPKYKLKITRLGTGMPSNSTLEYQDSRTLGFSLQNRIEL